MLIIPSPTVTLGQMEGSVPENNARPARLGEFKVRQVLGQGGSGTVYEARWGHRSVALKVLRKALVPSESEQQRFMSEARILADVNHPAVVKVLGFGELPDGRPYLAMERLEGETLAQRLKRGPLAVAETVGLFHQLAGAVQTLHERGLIHRDIKPENVFLVEGGEFAVLLDFGIAKELDAPDSTVTREGGVRGTPAYMAPERFFGTQANVRTDIYELALTFYAMVAGQLPWKDPNDPMGRLNPQRPSAFGVKLPGTLEDELLKALNTRAEARPESVKAWADRVIAATGQVPSSGRRRTADLQVPDGQTLEDSGGGAGQAGMLADAPTVPAVVQPILAPVEQATGPFGDRQTTEPSDREPHKGLSRWQMAAVSVGLLVLVGVGLTLALVWATGGFGDKKKLTIPDKDAIDQALAVARKARPVAPRKTEVKPAALKLPPPRPARLDDALVWKLHPADAQIILRLSHADFQRSSFYVAFTGGLDHPQVKAVLGALRSMCAFDPLTELQWLAVSGKTKGKDPEIDMSVRGAWSRTDFENCVKGVFRLTDRKLTLKRQGDFTLLSFGGRDVWLAWPDDHTFFFTIRKKAGLKYLRARLAGKRAARSNRALYAMYKGVDPKATLWIASTEAQWLRGTPLQKVSSPLGMVASATADKALSMSAGFRYASAAAAARGAKEMEKELSGLRKNPYMSMVVTRAEVKTVGSTVTVAVRLNETASVLVGKTLAASVMQGQFGEDESGKKKKKKKKKK